MYFPLKARAFSSELKNASLWVNSKVQPASDCVTTYVCHLHNRKILFLKPANSKKRASNSVLVYNHGIVWDFEGWIDTILKGKRFSVTNSHNMEKIEKDLKEKFREINFQFEESQCGNFTISLSLRFYVKLILGVLKVENLPIQHVSKALNFHFYDFCIFWRLEFAKLTKFRAFGIAKTAVLEVD